MSPPLYGHYTTLAGLMGIVKSETLWATNIKFLNDEQEFQHALDMIKEIIPKANIAPQHSQYSSHREYVDRIGKELDSLDRYQADSVFTLSFSEETDLLSQWRGYCPANNGYCLIFEVQQIYETIKSAFEDCYLVACVYEIKQKETQLKTLLNNYWVKYVKAKSEKEKKRLLDQLARELMLLASYFKHPSFAEEKEHRIVVLLDYAPDANLQFREGRFSLIPYIELPAPRKSIQKICIGPTGHKQLARRALETFLDNCYGIPATTLGDLKITFSSTPFRPW